MTGGASERPGGCQAVGLFRRSGHKFVGSLVVGGFGNEEEFFFGVFDAAVEVALEFLPGAGAEGDDHGGVVGAANYQVLVGLPPAGVGFPADQSYVHVRHLQGRLGMPVEGY